MCRGNHDNDLVNAHYNFDDYDFDLHMKKIIKCPNLLSEKGRLKTKYIKFLDKTKYYIETDDFYFVHAGIDFSVKNPLEQKHKLCETILPDSNYEKTDKVTVCGHELQPLEKIKNDVLQHKNIIRLDNGCVYTRFRNLFDTSMYGNLLALNLDTYELLVQKNIDF